MWKCMVCGEQIEEDFDTCWNCQTSKDGEPPEIFVSVPLSKELKSLRERMANMTDEALSQIVNVNYKDYREEAILLARAELERRNLPMRPLAKFCFSCKTDLDDDAEFCVECQTPVAKESAKDVVLECPNCQKALSESSKFCKYCAAEIALLLAANLCSNCNSELEDDAKFCAECRTPVAKDGKLECPNCQKALSAGSKFCKHCAAEIAPQAKASPVFARNSNASVYTPRTKANNLVTSGAVLAVVSALAFLWGQSYTSNWANTARAGFGNLVGHQDSVYQLAQYCIILGALGFIVGVVLFIVGLSKR